MLAWLCSMLNTGSKLWLSPVRSSDVLACSRSLRVRPVLCWIKSAALHVPCPALLSTSLCLILYSCSFSLEEPLSHLIWYEPQVVAHQPKLLANSFMQFTTFFLKEKGNSCLSKDQSQTAGRLVVQPARLLQPPAAARLSWQQPERGTPSPSLIPQPSRPSNSSLPSCTVHTSLCLAQAFPKGLEKAGYTHASIFWHWIRYGDCSAWARLVMPPHSCVPAFSHLWGAPVTW